MKDKPPRVSVILTTYARAATFLREAIESVLNQTLTDLELIVVDDASPDRTSEVVLSFKDERIVYLRRGWNSGYQAIPKNDGIRLAHGKYICYLDDDNQFTPDHVQVLVEALDAHPEVDIVYGNRQHVGAELGGGEKPSGWAGNAREFDLVDILSPEISNFIDTSDLMHRKEAIYRVGGWNPHLKKRGDYDLIIRFAKAGCRFLYVPRIITCYRQHKGQITEDKSNWVQDLHHLPIKVDGLSEEMIPGSAFNYFFRFFLWALKQGRKLVVRGNSVFQGPPVSEARKLSDINMERYARRLQLRNNMILDVGIAGNPVGGGYRRYFDKDNNTYKTLDILASTKPDYVMDISHTSFEDDTWDLIIFIHTLEHIENFRAPIEEIHRILKKGGFFILETPFNYKFHAEPGFQDLWRFTVGAYQLLLRDYEIMDVGQWGGEKDNPLLVSALARKY